MEPQEWGAPDLCADCPSHISAAYEEAGFNYSVSPPPSPTQEQLEATDVSDAKLLEVARAWEEKESDATTPDANTVSKSEESLA